VEEPSMTEFLLRLVMVVFAGGAVGLLAGIVARYALSADVNIFAGMSWGILVGSLGLALWYAMTQGRRRLDQD